MYCNSESGEKHLIPLQLLPVEVVFDPSWWAKNAGITFDEDYFYHPVHRVETERRMEELLYEKWGQYGLGADRNKSLPLIGATHLAAGFMVSQMLGCKVEYSATAAPKVECAQIEDLNLPDKAFESKIFRKFENLVETLQTTYGYTCGDVNWGGILNISLDLRGQDLFLDLRDRSEDVIRFFRAIAAVLERFTNYVKSHTGTTSISVNRLVKHFEKPVLLHSECSHTMISVADYNKFLFEYDLQWSRRYRPYGIHYCGKDAHRFCEEFKRVEHLDFLDVGWGSDVKILRASLPNTFFNLRLSPVELINQSENQIRNTILRLVGESGNQSLTGVCCVNIDHNVTEQQITTIFETVAKIRKELTIIEK
jgi:hypothetical protein